MAVTIKDVAKRANVATSTVSRVIQDSPKISEATKLRVRKEMKALGYEPNYSAQSLANRVTQSIGIIMPESDVAIFQNPFFPESLRGISEWVNEHNYTLSIVTGKTNDELLSRVKLMTRTGRVDGYIVLYSKQKDSIVEYLHKEKIPYTVIGKPQQFVSETTHVDNDNYQAAKDVVTYLTGLNHQRIAYVGGDQEHIVNLERLRGYQDALREVGLPLPKEYVVREPFNLEDMRALLQATPPPTAMIVSDDLVAMAVQKMLAQLGVSMPEQLSMVSFNNLMLAELMNPPLTSVDIDIFTLGYQAAKSLIEKIEDPKELTKHIIVPHRIVERKSSQVL
ncbi:MULTISPECIES: LacI family DNA-binding transcriptional regulator [Paenibacillus]|uniref:LacI family DNA-binding transcriptional regulator n=1 Tax=Paenibacillus polymyxa TaxID=1406 RepID=A0A8I1IVE1_PAEPO|nr:MULTISPECIES: LacI family DNA-binding transcriptional regulator [Paenibacillus]KAF6571825.1 LacI family DNA-binding transcriptional regulator [Paenibacillus sp. EKM206P]KAF6586538.1 LacI family DNA-binding transcriptional regulator [Paenibacillus sp. EKM205P]KEO76881.1 LacI family transcriptional regulator [Paenibacillus polymyxa]MBM0635182.1 LacI family DNA-binding transcriptional regulator [Paenibacillus polymyxa]MCH6190277.1 LacI family DNA-binding transcriptional regulator [Paenibacillu